MATDPSSGIELSIWRSAHLPANYRYEAESSPAATPPEPTSFLKLLYQWNTGPEDPLASADAAAQQRIRSCLLDSFARSKSAELRGVPVFRDVVSELLGDPAVLGHVDWSDCVTSATSETGEELPLRANGVAMLLRHFLWVAHVYADVPSASVLIR